MESAQAYPRNASALSTLREAVIMNPVNVLGFRWRDGERIIRFGRGVSADAVPELGGPGYLLLTTPRAKAQLSPVADGAAALAWARTAGGDGRVVALGGGRVVDVAKAVAAALGGGARALAIPTTLSGAEMTHGHRHAEGVDEATPRVRCTVVVYDPALAASQPQPELAASALNALGHAVEAPCTVAANPVATLVAHDASRRLVGAFAGGTPDRDELALGALLAGYAIDSTGLGLHHVLAQTLVRHGLAAHGAANAVMLPHTIPALARRFPDRIDPGVAESAARLCALTGATRLRDLGVDAVALDACVEAAVARPQLDFTPPRAGRDEVRAVYRAAW